jgi:hypothetical protein
MRDPVHRVDPIEADIEDTRRFLKGCMESETWKADPDERAAWMRTTIYAVEASNLEDWAKTFAISALLKQTEKRPARKPTRYERDHAIREAAWRLVVTRGYKPTRNDVTRDRDSASSIIHQALNRLGEKKLAEKSINGIVMRGGADYLTKHKVSPLFYEWLRDHGPPESLYLFESDPNAPDPVDSSGRPGVLK